MPRNCCVYGCTNIQVAASTSALSFHNLDLVVSEGTLTAIVLVIIYRNAVSQPRLDGDELFVAKWLFNIF